MLDDLGQKNMLIVELSGLLLEDRLYKNVYINGTLHNISNIMHIYNSAVKISVTYKVQGVKADLSLFHCLLELAVYCEFICSVSLNKK